MREDIDMQTLSNPISKPRDTQEYITTKRIKEQKAKEYIKLKNHLEDLIAPVCPTCKQEIDQKQKTSMIYKYNLETDILIDHIKKLEETILGLKASKILYDKYIESTNEFEKLTNLIDLSIGTKVLNELDLKDKVFLLRKTIKEIKIQIKDIADKNIKIEKHNSTIEVIKTQLIEYNIQLDKLLKELDELEEELGAINILRKSFSNSGLLNYKIEFLVKDLEVEINKYLQDFSEGRFQLYFKLDGEKLNIDILDKEHSTSINSLSSGQLARVNISTLLAIRKLMSTISSTRINVLFMDEVMGVLDTDGKDKLIDILLTEKELNTFLVSHEYSHPLLSKINIMYEKGISRLEYG